MKVEQLDTPALVVDLDIFDRNLTRVSEFAAQHNLRLRPHTKTHKSPEIARRQLKLGAAGLTVAKIGEAEILVPELPPIDLLIAFPIFGEEKVKRLKKIAAQTPVTVALDSLEAAEQLKGTGAGILVEIDVGLGRVGVTPQEAIELSKAVQRIDGVTFRGITFYPGHIKNEDPEGIKTLSQVISKTAAALNPGAPPTSGVPRTMFHVTSLNETSGDRLTTSKPKTGSPGCCCRTKNHPSPASAS